MCSVPIRKLLLSIVFVNDSEYTENGTQTDENNKEQKTSNT